MITPTDEQVEAAAEVLFLRNRLGGDDGRSWGSVMAVYAEEYRMDARAALTAAFSLAAPAGTVEAIDTAAEVIWEGFGERMGGKWAGKDSSMMAGLCYATAEEIYRRSALLPPQPSAEETKP